MNDTTETDTNQRDRRPSAIDRILHSRGIFEEPAPHSGNDQRAIIDSGGKPQMTFSIELANGEIHGFQYFNIDNLKFTPTKSGDHLSFDHRGKIVLLQGKRLKPLWNAIVQQSLVLVKEDRGGMPGASETLVNRVEVITMAR